MVGPEQRIARAFASTHAQPVDTDSTDAIRVLFIEDDTRYREPVTKRLSEQGFAVRSFADSRSFLVWLAAPLDAELIVLSWSLRDISGLTLLRLLRRLEVNLPVVFLSDICKPSYEILAFEGGAVDFIDKARGMEVLVRRFKRAVEATRPAPSPSTNRRVVCGKLALEPNVCRAQWCGVDLGLTVGEFKIVELLASNAGRYVTYRAIYDGLRREGFVAGRGQDGYRTNVRAAVLRIRNKFRQTDPAFGEIDTYRGFGYCWRKPA
jgi:two-component system response regulator ChvI